MQTWIPGNWFFHKAKREVKSKRAKLLNCRSRRHLPASFQDVDVYSPPQLHLIYLINFYLFSIPHWTSVLHSNLSNSLLHSDHLYINIFSLYIYQKFQFLTVSMNLGLALIYLKLPHWSHVRFLIFMCLLVESHLYSFKFQASSLSDRRLSIIHFYRGYETLHRIWKWWNDIMRYQGKYILYLSNSKIMIIIIICDKSLTILLLYFGLYVL